jgi:cell wall-associated NlpC family hydrolase
VLCLHEGRSNAFDAHTVKILVKRIGVLLLLVSLAYPSFSFATTRAAAATQGDQIAAYAASQANVPYCDGGGSINGPTNGGVVEPGCGVGVRGFDCVTLVQYAVFQATGIVLPGDGTQPTGVGAFIAPQATSAEDTAPLLPGDAVFWGGSGINGFVHSGVYAGGGNVWDAININQPVQLHTMTYLRSVYSYDGAMRFWGTGAVTPTITSGGLVTPVVGMASTPKGDGYWLTDATGGVSAHGAAVDNGSMAGHPLNAPIAHIVSSPDGRGYWLVAEDGGIFSFGDAPFYGSMGGQHLNAPIVGISADDATGGYWEVAADGGIFSFRAPFLGSTGGIHLNRPVNGMASLVDGEGYWFVASDGGIFSGGSAVFRGSMGGTTLNAPVVGMASDPSTGGYWLVASDGGVFSFDAPFYGAG